MIDGTAVIGLILARGGSKRLPRKNLREIAGKPLIVWTIEAAKGAQYLDRLILSSDDPEIIAAAREAGCEVPFRRPAELARDDSPSSDAVVHALDSIGQHEGYVAMLQPTSPLRTAADIDGCIAACAASGAPACISVTEVDKSPYWMLTLKDDGCIQCLFPKGFKAKQRQDLRMVYHPNGAVYVARIPWFLRHRTFWSDETLAYVMPRERSVDIDTDDDLRLAAERIFAQRINANGDKGGHPVEPGRDPIGRHGNRKNRPTSSPTPR